MGPKLFGVFVTLLAVTSFAAEACQTLGAGCSADIPCCSGLSCGIVSSIWGFCQSGGGGGGNTGGATTKKPNPNPGGNAIISQSEFERAVMEARPEAPYPRPTYEQYQNVIQRASSRGRINTKRELAMFLANILWESDGLRAKEEYNPPPGHYVVPGCDAPGKSYHGRGYMQLSWCYNYRDASFALYGDNRLVQNPEQVATNDGIAWDTTFWYWSSRVHDKPGISEGHFGVSIMAINGGLECGNAAIGNDKPRKRYKMYQNIFRVFAIPGSPIETGCYN